MKSDEIRSAFLSFFEGEGHKIIPSSSLIPHGDPTLLLTTAGMVQFKPHFLGQETPPSPRLTSCQKSFRTTDIERVGDPTHLTFFEMLGNFSIGDYFKKEAIAWGWEFVTEVLKIPKDKLWITIFLDDDEAFRYWREIGVPAERITRLGEKDNFWGPAGDSGPCGPCSEIYYDLGFEFGCGRDTCAPGCECSRFCEIWNLVFVQYNQDKNGKRVPLPRPSIDTGMGLERVVAVMQGKRTVYETDVFAPLLERIARLSGKKYGAKEETDHAMRIVAEHSRGIAFLIGDGVLPSNEGRGYVLRRLLRRASLFGRRLGLDKPFLTEITQITIERMSHVYPELKQRRDTIMRVAETEEKRFSETLNTGLEVLDGIMAETVNREQQIISGEAAFKLYDTYGFPVEITAEVARERGFSVDLAGFKAEMEKQRERARATHRFEIGKQEAIAGIHDIKPTQFIGYATLQHESRIAGVLLDGSPAREVTDGQEAGIILEATPFYGEMGGQVGDTGEISGPTGRFQVTDTVRIAPGIILHQGKVTEGVLSVGDTVTAAVDEQRRRDIARNHTATHLLQMALRQVLGQHVQQRGSVVAPDSFTFDFSHLTALMPEELLEVQRLVNDKVRQALPVHDEELPYRKAIEQGVIALFDEKYGEKVRVLRVGRPVVSAELCGGTHVTTTGEIGFFYILSEHSIGSGLRRIEAVTGRRAEAQLEKHLSDLCAIAQAVGATLDNVREKLDDTLADYETTRRNIEKLQNERAMEAAKDVVNQSDKPDNKIGKIFYVAANVSGTSRGNWDINKLGEISEWIKNDIIKQGYDPVVVLGSTWEDKPIFVANTAQSLVNQGYDAGMLVRGVAEVTGGSGGGKKTFAQGGGKDKDKIDDALERGREIIKERSGT